MSKLLGMLFLIGWVTGQLLRWPGEFPVTFLDVAVGGMVVAKIREIRGIRGIRGICLILIASWILGLRLFPLQESIPGTRLHPALPGGLYLLRFLGYLWIIVNAKELLAPVKKFINPAFWIFVILAWVQYLFLPDTRFLLQYGWDEHYYRMIGTVLDPNYLGVMLGIIGLYAVKREEGRGKREEGEKSWKRSNFWLAVLALGGLAVTYSRASWAAVMVVGCWLLAPPRRRPEDSVRGGSARRVISGGFRGRLGKLGGLGILGVIGLIGIWFVVPKPGGEGVNLFRTNSIAQRIESWKEGINVWREHPWIGVGFNNYAVAKAHRISGSTTGLNRIDHAGNAPSSSWILLLATTGIIGMGSLGVIGGIGEIREMVKNKLWIGILMMIGVHAVFNNTMFYPPVLGLLALIKAASEE